MESAMSLPTEQLPQMRFDITESARILRISRATLYERVREGRIRTQKDGRRSFITARELQRYIDCSNGTGSLSPELLNDRELEALHRSCA
jgi:excisionase family DNA binding protein